MFKNILIPTDGSPRSQKAAASRRGARQVGRRQGHRLLRGAAGDADHLSQLTCRSAYAHAGASTRR